MYRVFFIRDGGDKEEGPGFETLEEALSAARASAERCDILLPTGAWYGREETVGIDMKREIDEATRKRLEDNANQAVAWMRSRPSRGKPED